MGGFSFVVFDTTQKQYIAIEHYDTYNNTSYSELAEFIDHIILHHKILKTTFKSVSIALDNHINTLTPKVFYSNETGKEILKFNHAILENENESHDFIHAINAYNSYSIPEELKRCFIKHFPKHVWKHNSSILIESLLQQFKLHEQKKIYISIQENFFELVVLQGKELKFFNTFEYKASTDLIYYLLFTCEQLNLNPDQIPTIIIGEIERESEIFKYLYKYIRNIEFIKRNPNYEYSPVFEQLEEHSFYKLLNQHLCVS